MADRYSLEVTHMLYCQPAKFTILGINVHLPVLWLLRLWGHLVRTTFVQSVFGKTMFFSFIFPTKRAGRILIH